MSKSETTTQERSPTIRIDSRDPNGWALIVQHDEVMAVKEIPFSGQRYYSTEDRPDRDDKQSTFGHSVDDVVAFYTREAYGADPVVFATLLQRVQEAAA